MAVQSAQTDLQSLLLTGTDPLNAVEPGINTIRMLQHFQSVVSCSLGCSRTNHAMQSFVGSTAWDHPYLMHMVLAVSILTKRNDVYQAPALISYVDILRPPKAFQR